MRNKGDATLLRLQRSNIKKSVNELGKDDFIEKDFNYL